METNNITWTTIDATPDDKGWIFEFHRGGKSALGNSITCEVRAENAEDTLLHFFQENNISEDSDFGGSSNWDYVEKNGEYEADKMDVFLGEYKSPRRLFGPVWKKYIASKGADSLMDGGG